MNPASLQPSRVAEEAFAGETGIEISAREADWSREHKQFFSWCPSRSLLASIRSYQRYASSRNLLAKAVCKLAVVRHHFWSVITGAEIPINTQIGGGLLLPHPNGVVIHSGARIGPNCLIFQQVTIGNRGDGVPEIGGHVDIGAGARVLGDIIVGDHSRIGANAVVLQNVPQGKTAIGVPAKILEHVVTECD